MADNEKKAKKSKKRKSDSDGVTVKRSYYSFSKYYPGGGSSQKYRRVMKETRDEKRGLKAVLAAVGLVCVVFIAYLTVTAALDISYAPTTQISTPAPTESTTSLTKETEKTTAKHTTEPSEAQTEIVEEPEREVNVTSLTEVQTEF